MAHVAVCGKARQGAEALLLARETSVERFAKESPNETKNGRPKATILAEYQ